MYVNRTYIPLKHVKDVTICTLFAIINIYICVCV